MIVKKDNSTKFLVGFVNKSQKIISKKSSKTQKSTLNKKIY